MRPKIITIAAAVLLLAACQAGGAVRADLSADQTTQLLEETWGVDGNARLCQLWEMEGQERILEELDAGEKVTESAVVAYFERTCD